VIGERRDSHAPVLATLRILLPIHGALVPGGIATVLKGLVPGLRAAMGPEDHLVVVSPREGSGRLAQAISGIGRPAGALARLAYEQVALPRRAAACDTVHLSDARPILVSGRPFVLTVHDVSYLDEPEWYAPGAGMYKRLMLAAALAKQPAAVVCDSRHSRDRLLAHHPQAARLDVRVIAPGVAAPPADRPVRQADLADPYFLTVATIEPRKNHLSVLLAYREARARGLHLRWKVAGAMGHRHEPIVARLRAQEGVDVLGLVSDRELEGLYARALFVVAPSHQEGFGYVPLEAMARGVATVCSIGSGLDESVGDGALRIAPSDVDGWMRALLRLQSDATERWRLESAGRLRGARFGWDGYGSAVLACHRRALETAGRK